MIPRICIIIPIMIYLLNIDTGESCTVKKKIQIVVRTVSPPIEKEHGKEKTCKCGLVNHKTSHVHGRIINGTDADKNEYPWIVAIGVAIGDNPDKPAIFLQFCGGTLISTKTVVTAAHCLDGEIKDVLKKGFLSVAIGQHNRNKFNEGQRFVKVCNVTTHPRYHNNNGKSGDYDYGILTLCKELKWSNKVSPVCLPDISGRGAKYENKKAIAAGWGRINGSSSIPSEVLKVAVQTTITNKDCQAHSINYTIVSDQMICGLNPHQSACRGDSGGPLVVQDDGTEAFTIIGIVSWGDDFCTLGEPGVFARVTQQLDWIKSYIQGNRCL